MNTVELNKVTNTFVHLETELIILKSNETEITTTKAHPFWTKEKGWIFADELEVGDTFLSKTGEYHTLNSIYRETLAEPIFVYNIEVENAHTYFVSDSEILVHNKAAKNPYSKSSLGKNTTKMTNNQLDDLMGEGWHKNSKEKKQFISDFSDELYGDTNVDFYVDKTTKEIYLKGNKSGVFVPTGQYVE